jgi:hypothetical protein
MKRTILVMSLLATALWAPAGDKPRVSRAALAGMEQSFNERIAKLSLNDPFDLLGATRGVYLEGYGAVFTTEVSLVIVPAITPFRMSVSKEEMETVRRRKMKQLPLLKQAMRAMLVASAASLNAVPPEEQIVVGVTLFYYSWENKSDLPSQLLMQAERKVLVDFHARRINEDALEASIRQQEL